MIDRELDIQTADGAMNTFVTHPEEGGPHPVVLFYMDAPGKRGELHDMARRLGTVGYFVILSNLYYRRDRNFRVGQGDEARRIMFEHMASLDRAKGGFQSIRDQRDTGDTSPRPRLTKQSARRAVMSSTG